MNIKEIEKRIEELTKEIEYEKDHMEYCGYSSNELRYLFALEKELLDLEYQLEELEE